MARKSNATRTATGVAALASIYYSKAAIANLKAQTPFMQWLVCACGHEGTVRVAGTLPVCDGCSFRLTVMSAAGREAEFWADYKTKRDAMLDNDASDGGKIDILKHSRSQLPVKSGKTIRMFNYKPVSKP